jgi:lysyl-tRNA synthetase class 2
LKEILKLARTASHRPPAKPPQSAEDDSTKDPGQYYTRRLALITDQLTKHRAGEPIPSPYPHYFEVTRSLAAFITEYGHIAPKEELRSVRVSLAGRIYAIRSQGQLYFLDLFDGEQKVQLQGRPQEWYDPESFSSDLRSLHLGDIAGAEGFPFRTARGELSLCASRIQLLAPCMHQLPAMSKLSKGAQSGFQDVEARMRHRHLDLIVNPANQEIFRKRAKMIGRLRQFLNERDFIEVETPVLWHQAGGATARPFVSHHNHLGIDLQLRIAPELFLKQCVVGGLHRVYEIGKNFRNEGMDTTHNPEFTTCEFYVAFADYNILMDMTEELLRALVLAVNGSLQVEIDSEQGKIVIDFSQPFARIDMIPKIEEFVGPLPPLEDTEEVKQILAAICEKFAVEVPPPRTVARMLDKMVGKFVEPLAIQPTFVINHPQVMSPLAKWHRLRPGVVERFEIFINGLEYGNAYTELNAPIVQREMFAEQLRQREADDDEAMQYDRAFCEALEYGMPPTGGWGLGLDRLLMLLTNKASIREVLLFPLMRPAES